MCTKRFQIVLGRKILAIMLPTVNQLGTILLVTIFSSTDLKYSLRSSSPFLPGGRKASMLQPEKDPGTTCMNLKRASKDFSRKQSQWVYICCALWISKNVFRQLVRQSTSYSFTIYQSATCSSTSLRQPQTPPTFGLTIMCLYILKMESLQGFTPTSSRKEKRGLSSWQKPLKNQLCELSLPASLYLMQKKRLTYKIYFLRFPFLLTRDFLGSSSSPLSI